MHYQYLLFPLLFFPSITFGLLPSEIFPWAIFASLFFIQYLQKDYIVLLTILLPFCCLALLNNAPPQDLVRSLFAFINAAIAFFLVMRVDEKNTEIICKILLISLYIILFFGVLQFYFNEINQIIKYLVPRSAIYETGELIQQGKGMPSLSSEPSRNAYEIFILVSLYHVIKNTKLRKRIIFDLFILIYIIYINRSAMGIAFFMVYLTTYLSFIKEVRIVSIILLVTVLIIAVPLISIDVVETRGTNLFRTYINSISLSSLQDFFFVEAGFRLSSVFASYLNFSFLGYGIGNWAAGSLEGLERFPFLYNSLNPNNYFLWMCDGTPCPQPIRASAFFAGIILETGILGAFFIIILIHNNVSEFKNDTKVTINKTYNDGKNISLYNFIPVIFSLFFMGDIGNPIPFVCLAILIKIYYSKK